MFKSILAEMQRLENAEVMLSTLLKGMPAGFKERVDTELNKKISERKHFLEGTSRRVAIEEILKEIRLGKIK